MSKKLQWEENDGRKEKGRGRKGVPQKFSKYYSAQKSRQNLAPFFSKEENLNNY